MNRKIAGILLMIGLLAPAVSSYLVLLYQKQQVKKEVKWKMIAGMDREELVLLKFTTAEAEKELAWEHAKEFEYRGEMYDVVEKHQIGDTTYYWCWWDHEETQLNQQLDHLVANILGNDPQRQDQQHRLTDLFKKLYYQNPADATKGVSPASRIRQPQYLDNFTSIFLSPPVPPPQLS